MSATTYDRNMIIEDNLSGDHAHVVAERYGISTSRVRQILGAERIPTRGRADQYNDTDCTQALDAFLADGGHSIHGYIAWSKGRGVPSWGTILNHGFQPYAVSTFAGRRTWTPPSVHDVRPIDPPSTPMKPIVEWLFINGCESVRSLGRYVGHRLRCDASLAARARGRNGWSLSELDQIHPDQTCGASR